MFNRIWLITKLEICNLFGLNQLRHCNDRKEKAKVRGLFVAYIILYFVFGFYSFAYAEILCSLGAANVIPSMFTLITFVLIVFTTILKAGNVLFNLKSYERLAPLPIRPMEIVVARFINIYITSAISALIFYLPAMILCGINIGAGITYYLILLVQIITMPLLAIAISILLGTLLMLITSRISHKNVFKSIFMILLSIGAIALSVVGQTMGGEPSEDFVGLINDVVNHINTYFLPSRFAMEAMIDNSLIGFFLSLVVSIVPFVIIALFTSWKFVPLCQKLNVVKKTKNKEIKEVKVSSSFWALTKKELKRLFSSSLYLTNSCIGYIILLIGAVVIPFVDLNSKFAIVGIQDLYSRIIVAAMGFMIFITTTTTSSISMEGKSWWIIKSLPVKVKEVMDSKIATNLIVALPFYFVATILNVIFLKSSYWIDYVVIILSPLTGIIFTTLFGLLMNIKHPLMIWTNEAEVCKQSKAAGFMMLFSTLILIVYMIPSIFLPGIFGYIYNIVFSVALLILSYLIYKKVCKTNIQSID